jgi:hypothetical protein
MSGKKKIDEGVWWTVGVDCGEERHRFVLVDDRGKRQRACWANNRRDKIEYRCQGKLTELCCGRVIGGEERGWRGARESSSEARSTAYTTDSLEGRACSATRKRRSDS